MQKATERDLSRHVPIRSNSTDVNLRRQPAKRLEKPVSIEKSSPEKITADSAHYNSHQVFINRTPQVSEKILSILDNESGITDYYFGDQSWENVTLDQLKVIENLSLHDKNLTTLHPLDFQGLASLKRIDLSDTGIEVLPEDIFREVPSLERLVLNPNFSAVTKVELRYEYRDRNLSISVATPPRQGCLNLNAERLTLKKINLLGWTIGLGSKLLYTVYARSNQNNPEAQQSESMLVPFLLMMLFMFIGYSTVIKTSMDLRTDHKSPKLEPTPKFTSDDCSGDDTFSTEGALLGYSAFLAATGTSSSPPTGLSLKDR